MSPLIICLSGKKRSGKNTATNFIAGTYLLRIKKITDFRIDKFGLLHCNKNSHEFIVKENEFNKIFNGTEVKLYSFADCLKEFCINVFGLTYEQCYGTEEQKNSLTDLVWKNMPNEKGITIENRYLQMKAREVLQYFGTDIIRKICDNAWVNATINLIKKDNIKLALITDARFVNEIVSINEIGGKTVRLLRNIAGTDLHSSELALDDFPKEQFSLVVNNKEMSVDEQCAFLEPHINKWLDSLYGK